MSSSVRRALPGSRLTRGGTAALVAGAVAAGLTLVPATASADPAPGDFYATPTNVADASPGDVLRSEPSPVPLSVPLPAGAFPGAATRILYRSTDAHGDPIAVSGTYFEPSVAWSGDGPRPLAVVAPGTQGQGDQCAPSHTFNHVVQYTPPLDVAVGYEALATDALLAQGIAVVVTDYEGLGTEGVHTYVNRAAEAHAVLDAARAAQRLGVGSVRDGAPTVLWGYSQGGGASGAAAELAPEYAPELAVKGAYVGAPPADLAAVLAGIDGGGGAGFIGYAINGLAYAYPEIAGIVDREINPAGRDMLDRVRTQCVGETVLSFAFRRTTEFTTSGESVSDLVARTPEIASAVDEQRIGRRTPEVPILIQHGVADDTVPYAQGRRLAVDWCDRGATVQFSSNPTPPILTGAIINHGIPYVAGLPESLQFVRDRLFDQPASGNCGAF